MRQGEETKKRRRRVGRDSSGMKDCRERLHLLEVQKIKKNNSFYYRK